MAGANFIDFEGKRILSIDIANAELEDIVRISKEVKLLIAKEPPKSVLTLTNVKGIRVHFGTIKVLKDLVLSNKPYVKAGALIGLSSLQTIELDIIMKFSGRSFPTFCGFKEAAEWLVKESTPPKLNPGTEK